MDTQWRSECVKVGAAACSWEILCWFSWNCKVRNLGCVCGGYFRVVALRMWGSCWKTGGLSPGEVVKHHWLQEELSPGG